MTPKDLSALRALLAPLALLALALTLHLFWPSFVGVSGLPGRWLGWGWYGTAIGLACGVAMLTRHLAQTVVTRHMGGAVPMLMRQMISTVIWALTVGSLGGIVFGIPVGSLLTTSGMFVAVLGIALKNLISDLFTGLLLPVKLGDWIEVDGQLGQVVEVSWRATRMLTRDQITVFIPNTHLVQKPFRNLSLPNPMYREHLRIVLPLSVTGEQAERILYSAAYEVEEVATLPKKPSLRILSFPHGGVEWELRYYVPSPAVTQKLRYRVYRNVLRNLRLSGISLPSEAPQIHFDADHQLVQTAGGDRAFLAVIDLFSCLTDDELGDLAASMERRQVVAGQAVVRQGDAGCSLFLVNEGLLEVVIEGDDGMPTVVGQLPSGQFFGEMSLLTGAPRSATVRARLDSLVYEITRDTLQPLLQQRPALAGQISEVLAERQLGNTPKLRAARQGGGPAEDRHSSLAQQLLKRISAFFRLQEMV